MAIADKKTPKQMEEGEVSSLNLGVQNIEMPAEGYVPEGFDDVEDYLDDVRQIYAHDIQADEDNRYAALEDKKFVAGEQWDPQVLQQRTGLPCLVINSIPQFTAQLVGDWRENKNGVKVLPAENGDKNVADIRSDLIRAIETQSRAPRVYDSAFESMVQCGDGAFRVAVKYTNSDVFDQDIVLEAIDDPLSVVWDSLSIDPTGRDANHCFVDDVMTLKEFNSRWPGLESSNLNRQARNSLVIGGWTTDHTVRVTEHWRIIERKKLLCLYEDGSTHSLEEKDYPDNADLTNRVEELGGKHGKMVKSRMAPVRYAQMHLVTGFKILAGPFEWKMKRLPIIRMSGRTISMGERRVRYGLVRFMKDAARLRNFWRSTAAEQLGYAPKAQWLAPESAVEGREDRFRKAHLSRDPLLIYNDDASAPPERIEPPVMQSALLNEAQINTQDMKDVTGIHDASLGIKSNETSGKAIMARQREGDVASLTYYDNGNAAILEAGDVINQLISQIYDGTRVVRIIGDDEASKLITINDPMDPKSPNLSLGNYDVAITSGVSYTTRRLEAAQAMMDAIQVFPEMMQYAGDLVVKAQDWPGAEEISERLLKTVPPQLLSDKEKSAMGDQPDMQGIMQQQAQMGQQLQDAQGQLQSLQQENQTLKIKAAIEAKKAQIEEFRAETERLKVLGDITAQGNEQQIKALELDSNMDNALHDKVMDVHGAIQSQQDSQHQRVMDVHGAIQGQQDAALNQQNVEADRIAKAKSGVKASTQPSE